MTAAERQTPVAETELAITGMTCASCVAHVGRALRKVPGVEDAAVNLATERARVSHEIGVSDADLIAAVERAGYGASAVRDETADEDARRRDTAIRRKRAILIFGVAMLVPIVALGMAPLAFAGKAWLLLALTLPVWLVVGGEFHRGALAALRSGTSNMDTLVSLGSTAALGYSIYASATGQEPYYDTAAAIVTLVFIGKFLETSAKGRSNRAIRALLDLRPAMARRRDADGSVREISVDDVRLGDTLIVAAGERIPVDGEVLEGSSAIDAAMLTGEPIPVAVEPGSAVNQGTLNGDGALTIRASAVGTGTALARIVELVRRAQGTTPPVQRLADRVAGIFVPAILSIAAVTFAAWMLTHHPWPAALAAAISVLVVACPCALGLATPTAVIAAVGSAAKRGLLFRDAEAIERLGRVQAVLFDKTGTLTIGKPDVLAIHPLHEDGAEAMLAAAAALEHHSTHPLASAIVHAARERSIAVPNASGVTVERGGGLRGTIGGSAYFAGNARFLRERGVAIDGEEQAGATRVYVARENELLGFLDLGDAVRPESAAAVARLRSEGILTVLVSGDSTEPARAVAERLGIDRRYAHVSPEEKAGVVRELQQSGLRVAFAGDGINDAPALATADVGIAMGGGTAIALETAQAAVISNDPRAIAMGIALSRATLRTIAQNLFWAFAYNVVLVPLAALGIVHPIMAAGAMGASSLFVVGNSLLLARSQREQY